MRSSSGSRPSAPRLTSGPRCTPASCGMEGGWGFARRAPVPLREGGGREGEDVGPAVARGPLDGPERGGAGVLRGGDGGDPRDLAWDGRIHRREDDRARRV